MIQNSQECLVPTHPSGSKQMEYPFYSNVMEKNPYDFWTICKFHIENKKFSTEKINLETNVSYKWRTNVLTDGAKARVQFLWHQEYVACDVLDPHSGLPYSRVPHS